MLKANLHGTYAKNGKRIYTYLVTGKVEELEAYKNAQGPNYRATEDGSALYFRSERDAQGVKRLIEKSINLLITNNNRIVEDTLQNEVTFSQQVQAQLAGKVAEAMASSWIQKQQAPATVAAPTEQPKIEAAPTQTANDLINELVNQDAGGTENIDGSQGPK